MGLLAGPGKSNVFVAQRCANAHAPPSISPTSSATDLPPRAEPNPAYYRSRYGVLYKGLERVQGSQDGAIG